MAGASLLALLVWATADDPPAVATAAAGGANGLWDGFLASVVGSLIGAAIGAAVAIWIMYRTIADQKRLAAESAEEDRRRFEEQLAHQRAVLNDQIVHQREMLDAQIEADRNVMLDERLANSVARYNEDLLKGYWAATKPDRDGVLAAVGSMRAAMSSAIAACAGRDHDLANLLRRLSRAEVGLLRRVHEAARRDADSTEVLSDADRIQNKVYRDTTIFAINALSDWLQAGGRGVPTGPIEAAVDRIVEGIREAASTSPTDEFASPPDSGGLT